MERQVLHSRRVQPPTVDLKAGAKRCNLNQINVVEVQLLNFEGTQHIGRARPIHNDLVRRVLQLCVALTCQREREDRQVIVDTVEANEAERMDHPPQLIAVEIVVRCALEVDHLAAGQRSECDQEIVGITFDVEHHALTLGSSNGKFPVFKLRNAERECVL